MTEDKKDKTKSQPSDIVEATNNKSGPDITTDPETSKPPEIPASLAKSVPSIISREEFSAVIGGMFRAPSTSLIDKMEPEHIPRVIDQIDKSDERDFNKDKSVRRYIFATFLTIVALVIFFTIYLSKVDPDTYKDMMTLLIGLGAGLGGGYGLGRWHSK